MNFRSRGIPNAISGACAAGLFCLATACSAQAVYRQVDAAGSITYTDRPDPEAAEVSLIVSSPDAPVFTQRGTGVSARRANRVDVSEAARRLSDARAQRVRGEAPLPGERSLGADLGPVNERYWTRQEALRRMVELALVRWNETRGQSLVPR